MTNTTEALERVREALTRADKQFASTHSIMLAAWKKRGLRPFRLTPRKITVTELFDISASEIRLMAGEMSAQEMRTVKAVLAGLKARATAEFNRRTPPAAGQSGGQSGREEGTDYQNRVAQTN